MNEYENNDHEERESGPSFASRFFRVLLRMLVVVIFGILIGAAAYYGIPALYRNLVQPVQTNSERIIAVEEALSELRKDLQEQKSESASDYASLEGQLAGQREAMAELLVENESLNTSLEDFEARLEDVEALPAMLETLETRQEEMLDTLATVQASLEDLQNMDSPVQQLERKFQLLRVMELVTRARFWMIEDNLGLASQDVASAREILAAVLEGAPQEQQVGPIIERLDQILLELPEKPVIAADDLEIVWKLLIQATEPEKAEVMQPENENGGME